MSDFDDQALRRQHVNNMTVRQSRIHQGDVRWFVETANGFVTKGPFRDREHAELALAWIRNQAEEDE